MTNVAPLNEWRYDVGRHSDAQGLELWIIGTRWRISCDKWWRYMIKKSTMFVIINNQKNIFPNGGVDDDGINPHEKFLSITDAGGRMLICAKANMRAISIGRFDEDYLRQLIWWRFFQIFLEIIVKGTKMITVKKNVRYPFQHECEKGNALMINAPTYLMCCQPVINQILSW